MLTERQRTLLKKFVSSVIRDEAGISSKAVRETGSSHCNCCLSFGIDLGTYRTGPSYVLLFVEHHPFLPQEVAEYLIKIAQAQVIESNL